jgi:FAD/FMN-containing dehydrogenase
LTCRPSRTLVCVHAGTIALERFDAPVNICVHPSIAAADLWIGNRGNADPDAVFRDVAAAVLRAGGGTARLRRPFENHGGVLEGVKSANFAIMERLKRHFDPRNLLNPGILPFPVKPGEFAPPEPAAPRAS